MRKTYQNPTLLLAMVLAGMLATGSAHADKPDWVNGGGDKEGKGQHKEKSAKNMQETVKRDVTTMNELMVN